MSFRDSPLLNLLRSLNYSPQPEREGAVSERLRPALSGETQSLRSLLQTSKRKVFVSYHHLGDQAYANYFRQFFCENLEIFSDQSLDRLIDSEETDYVQWAIRQEYIKGSSVSVVLCGAETPKRKFVDWEIYHTLEVRHAILGIILPTARRNINGKIMIPDRLFRNIETGYAHCVYWDSNWTQNPYLIKQEIEQALNRSRFSALIDNSQPKRKRNIS